MDEYYCTFGQNHYHTIGDKVFDANTLILIRADSVNQARKLMFHTFGIAWGFSYNEHEARLFALLSYYPNGAVDQTEWLLSRHATQKETTDADIINDDAGKRGVKIDE